jgi:hypothetical protein
MGWFKRQVEKVIPHQHDFTLSYLVGDFHKYHCIDKSCDIKKYTLETRLSSRVVDSEFEWIEPTTTVLSEEEAKPYIENSEASLRATMWLLDNVEPTASAGRDDGIDYKYKTENGKIVEK